MTARARVVLDASAAIQIVLNRPHTGRLVAQLEAAAIVTVPDLFCVETANAFWKYVNAEELDLDLALRCYEEALRLVDEVVPQRALAPEALVAAAKYKHGVYDMTYAVLARRLGATVLTMDRRFARVLVPMEIESYCPLLEV